MSGSYTLNGHSYTAVWSAPTNPLNCAMAATSGQFNYVQTASNVPYDVYTIVGGVCTEILGPLSGSSKFRITISLAAPNCDSVYSNWHITVNIPGIVRWEFEADDNCDAPGTFSLVDTFTNYSPGCILWSGGYAANIAYTVGTVTLT